MKRNGKRMGIKERSRVAMSDDEIADFVAASRTAVLATLGKDGHPHLVAMAYAVIDGRIWLETKAKSQKVVNLRRDARTTLLIEDGQTYDELRGVSFEGIAEIHDDPESIFRVGVNVWERYHGPYSEEVKPQVDALMNNRVVIRVIPDRTRSWDHTKLGLPPATAEGMALPTSR